MEAQVRLSKKSTGPILAMAGRPDTKHINRDESHKGDGSHAHEEEHSVHDQLHQVSHIGLLFHKYDSFHEHGPLAHVFEKGPALPQ